MTRTRRIAGGAAWGALNQLVAVVVGLWLVRFTLDQLGQHDYGLWLVGLQIAGYLGIADIGVVAILPRQTAFVTATGPGGRGAEDAPDAALAELAGHALRLVLWQVPLVALAALALWLVVPASWGALRAPLAVLLVGFVAAFPLRVFPALLQGLQDLAFLGRLQLLTWTLNTALVIGLLLAGSGMYALAAGWVAGQFVPPLFAWRRLRARFPDALPAHRPHLSWAEAKAYLARSTWVSVGQVANALMNGVDLLIIGAFLGPAAVVPYSVTGKLVTVFGNLPLLLTQSSGPALSELRVSEGPPVVARASSALAQAVLVASGAVAAVVLATNAGFVTWWVGPAQYGGLALTVLFVVTMVLRHYATTVVYAVYSFGHERRLALIGLAEGAAGAALAAALVLALGVTGAVLGTLVAVVAVTLPLAVPVVARDTGTPLGTLLRSLVPWAWRLALLLGVALGLGLVLRPAGPFGVAAVALLTGALYAAVAGPFVLRPPLREYTLQIRDAVRARLRRGPAATAA